MSEWFETTEGLYRKAWQLLGRGVADRRSAARHPVLATVAPDGWPQARTIVLRAADAEAATLEIHTDKFSDKIVGLRDYPMAALHVWDAKLRLQIRAQAEVFIIAGVDADAAWSKVPDPAREAYGTTPPPGTVIPDALAYDTPGNRAAFAILHLRLVQLDLLHLGEDHRRASFARDRDWRGQWLAP